MRRVLVAASVAEGRKKPLVGLRPGRRSRGADGARTACRPRPRPRRRGRVQKPVPITATVGVRWGRHGFGLRRTRAPGRPPPRATSTISETHRQLRVAPPRPPRRPARRRPYSQPITKVGRALPSVRGDPEAEALTGAIRSRGGDGRRRPAQPRRNSPRRSAGAALRRPRRTPAAYEQQHSTLDQRTAGPPGAVGKHADISERESEQYPARYGADREPMTRSSAWPLSWSEPSPSLDHRRISIEHGRR